MKIEIVIYREQGAQKFLTETTYAEACTITTMELLQTPEEIKRISELFLAATHYIQQYSKSIEWIEVRVNDYPVIRAENANCVKQAPHLWRKVLDRIYEMEASI